MSSAKDIRTLRNLSSKLVECEERDRFFGNLTRSRIGVKEVEDYARRQMDRVKNLNNILKGKMKKEIISQGMDNKMRDNRELAKKLRSM